MHLSVANNMGVLVVVMEMLIIDPLRLMLASFLDQVDLQLNPFLYLEIEESKFV